MEKELEMILDEIGVAVERWSEFARVAGVSGAVSVRIYQRLVAMEEERSG